MATIFSYSPSPLASGKFTSDYSQTPRRLTSSLHVNSRTLTGRSNLTRKVLKNNFSRCSSIPPNSPSEEDGGSKLAPLEPQSPTGQFLTQILSSHPHLFNAAAEQQLDLLVSEKVQNESKKSEQQNSGNELILYKRIAEVREAERKRALEEVVYALIVHKFREAGAPLVPQIPFFSMESISPTALVASISPSRDKELLAVHSVEAKEMVLDHLAIILGSRPNASMVPEFPENKVVLQTSKIRVGQVYAASIMYGYFLRRVDQRFQLEKTMTILAEDGNILDAFDVGESPSSSATKEEESKSSEDTFSPLRKYVMSFDLETLQKTAVVRSKESITVIEKHTEALFGRPELSKAADGSIVLASDDQVGVTLATLKRVILEAVAFGSFLWDVESYVENRYSNIEKSLE